MNLYNTTASGLIQHFFGSGIYSKPATIAIGLTSVPPTNNSITEISNANGYARVNIGQNSTAFGSNAIWNFPTELSGIVYNNSAISFAQATGGIGWVSGFFVSDSASYGAGNILFYGNLSNPKDLENLDIYTISASGCSGRFY